MPFGVNQETGLPGPAPEPARDGDKIQARQRVNMLVKNGRLPRPEILACKDCSHLGADREHEYDHHLGYAAEHHLDVEPVCTKCHGRRESARITHCKHRHEFTAANTYVAANGTRHCKECRRAADRDRSRDAQWWRDYRAKRRANG